MKAAEEPEKPEEVVVKRVIVSRHPAAIEFIRREIPEFKDAPVVSSATVNDVCGAEVAGNLPLDLASYAYCVYAIVFNGTPPRGQEYTLEDMDKAGAAIRFFRVFSETDDQMTVEEVSGLVSEAYNAGWQDALRCWNGQQWEYNAGEYAARARKLLGW